MHGLPNIFKNLWATFLCKKTKHPYTAPAPEHWQNHYGIAVIYEYKATDR
jgi:hypothetical protein